MNDKNNRSNNNNSSGISNSIKERTKKTVMNANALINAGLPKEAKKHFRLSIEQMEREIACADDKGDDSGKYELGMLYYEYAIFQFRMEEYTDSLEMFAKAHANTLGKCMAWENVKEAFVEPNAAEMHKKYNENIHKTRIVRDSMAMGKAIGFEELCFVSFSMSNDCYYLVGQKERSLERVEAKTHSLKKPGTDIVAFGNKYYMEALKAGSHTTVYIITEDASRLLSCLCFEQETPEEIVVLRNVDGLQEALSDPDVSIPENVFANADEKLKIEAVLHEASSRRKPQRSGRWISLPM